MEKEIKKKVLRSAPTKTSFQDSWNRLASATITLYHQDKPYVFLIDTGAQTSYILPECLKNMHYKTGNAKAKIAGLDGEIHECNYLLIPFRTERRTLDIVFTSYNCTSLLEKIEKTRGYHLDGILGVQFLYDVGMDINFKTLMIKF